MAVAAGGGSWRHEIRLAGGSFEGLDPPPPIVLPEEPRPNGRAGLGGTWWFNWGIRVGTQPALFDFVGWFPFLPGLDRRSVKSSEIRPLTYIVIWIKNTCANGL